MYSCVEAFMLSVRGIETARLCFNPRQACSSLHQTNICQAVQHDPILHPTQGSQLPYKSPCAASAPSPTQVRRVVVMYAVHSVSQQDGSKCVLSEANRFCELICHLLPLPANAMANHSGKGSLQRV